MIKVENVTFAYENDNFLFKNLSFDVQKGETLSILGAKRNRKDNIFKMYAWVFKSRKRRYNHRW